MNFKKFFKSEDGASAVIVALSFTFLLGVAALGVDLGSGYTEKVDMQAACDFAALAGAKYLPDAGQARTKALDYITKNGFDNTKADVSILDCGQKIVVSLKEQKPTYFAGAIGINKLNISTKAVAVLDSTPGNGDFDYAIFSGSETAALSLSSGVYNVNGKVHSNGTLKATSHAAARGYSSNKGGYLDPWNCDIISDDGQGGTTKTAVTNTTPEKTGVIDMPMYLGENMDALIHEPELPAEDYWENTISTDQLGTWAQAGKDFKSYLGENKRVHLIITSGGAVWFDYACKTSADLYVECSKNGAGLQTGSKFEINGDVYINNTSGGKTILNSNSNGVINGNVYVLKGGLEISNLTINGNVYVDGQLTTNSGTSYINAPDFIFADSINTQNSLVVSGTIVTNGDISFVGGEATGISNATLSVYSRHGNITMNTANSTFHGIVFAPEGKISMVANGTIYGKIIGYEVAINTATLDIGILDRDLGFDTTNPNPIDTKKIPKLVE